MLCDLSINLCRGGRLDRPTTSSRSHSICAGLSTGLRDRPAMAKFQRLFTTQMSQTGHQRPICRAKPVIPLETAGFDSCGVGLFGASTTTMNSAVPLAP